MKLSTALAIVLASLVVHLDAHGEDASHGKQLQFEFRVLEGDPLGSLKNGTQKVLAEPSIVTFEKRRFQFISGGEVAIPDENGAVQFAPIGQTINGTPGAVKDGKVRLDLTLSNTTQIDGADDALQLVTESHRTISTVSLNETVKFRWKNGAPDNQAWVELTVQEVKPLQIPADNVPQPATPAR